MSLCRIRSNNSILPHTNRKILASKHIFSCILKQIISFDSIITSCVSIIISYDYRNTTYDLVIDAVPKHFVSANDAIFKRVFGRFFKSFLIFCFSFTIKCLLLQKLLLPEARHGEKQGWDTYT